MKKKKTRERIVQAAIKVFSENGYERSHVEDILIKANICKGTFYRHFRSKSDLLERACQEFLFSVGGEWYEFIKGTSDPVKGIEFHIDFVFTIVYGEKTAATYFELWARGVRSEAGRISSKKRRQERPGAGIYKTLRENIARFYEWGRDDGLLAFETDPEMMASLLIAAVDGICTQYLLDPASLDFVRARDLIKKKYIYDLMPAG
jgi:AcrR family transcriptional regulator